MSRRSFLRRVKMKGPTTFRDVDFLIRMLRKPFRPTVLQRRR